MTSEDITSWREISDFFLRVELEIEYDYQKGKITEKEKNRLQNRLKKDWDYSMIVNNPFIKSSPYLREVAKRLLKLDNFP